MNILDLGGALRLVVGFDEDALIYNQCEHALDAFEIDGEIRYDFLLNFYSVAYSGDLCSNANVDVQWNMDDAAYDVYIDVYTDIAMYDFACVLSRDMEEAFRQRGIPCKVVPEPLNDCGSYPFQVQVSCTRC